MRTMPYSSSSMEQEKLHFAHKEDFVFAGAIFMSNRATKLECLQRKLFGLPQSKAKFMEQVKAGMILFLFEHEERKLYGVFEATSDGALNIIPDAFRSTGQSYPAQICCKRIVMCRPLCEDEFRSAIQDNYYSPNKFHFGLSYDQVTNLIHLFYSKKINLKQHQKPVIPNRIIKRPENSAAENVRLTEVGSYAKCQSDEYSREGNWKVRREYTLRQSSLNLPMHYTVTDTGRGSNQVNLHALEPQPSRSQHFYSEPFDSSCSSLFVPNDRAPFCHFSTGKQCSTTEDMYYNKPLPQESDRYMTKFDSVAVPYSMGPHHYSSPDVAACMLSCDNMIPRQIKIQEPHVFESLCVVTDDRHQTAVLQHTSVYGAQPKQLFKFPDYIPLPEDLRQEFVEEENHNSGRGNFECASSATFRSCIPSTGKEISEAFYIDDDDELKIYPRLVSDDDPVVSRASVFSRLSRGQNVCNPKTPESPTSLPLDQLLNTLGSRRERWSTTEASKQSGKRGGGDQYDCTVSTELFNQSSGRQDKFAVQPAERSKADQYESITETKSVGFDTSLDYDQVIELSEKGSFELPFYNFRRRNMSQKFEVQDDLNTGSKKRRILRPSLYGEEQNAKGKAKVKTLSPMISEDEKENKANCLKSELEGESVSSFVHPETELKTPTQVISEHKTESQVSSFQTHQKSELEVESVSSFVRPETELKTPTQAISEHETESKVPGFQIRQKSELEFESVSSFVRPEIELKTPTQVISEHKTESKVPGFQTCQKSELEVESVSSFVCPETEPTPAQVISEHETESMVPGFQTRQKFEMQGKSVSSFLYPETELKSPTQAISKHETESKVPGFQTRQKSEIQGESDSSFLCPQTELKPLTQAISEHETESKITGFQTHRKFKFEGESVEANAVTSVLGSEDYIPLD